MCANFKSDNCTRTDIIKFTIAWNWNEVLNQAKTISSSEREIVIEQRITHFLLHNFFSHEKREKNVDQQIVILLFEAGQSSTKNLPLVN